MEGCNSCKHLSVENKKPGRTSGYVYYCTRYGSWINVYKDSVCDSYEEALDRSTTERNAIYEDCKYYNDSFTDKGCNSCWYLDPKAKKPGKVSGCLYFCNNKKNYVNASKDYCENYKDGLRDSVENNEIYENSRNYDDDNTPLGTYLFIFVLIVIVGIICVIFLRLRIVFLCV